jgi:hypothetical protein
MARSAVDDGDIECRAGSEGEDNQQKDEAGGEMGGIVPGGWDVGEFCDGGKEHDDGGDGTAQGNGGPSHGSRRGGFVSWGVYFGGVESGVKVIDGYVKDPNAIEVDEEMGGGPFFEIGFEKDAIPLYFAEFHEALGWWDIDQTSLERRSFFK